MGCTELDAQVRRLRSQVHIFGHSHLNVDSTVQGVRYVQAALGCATWRFLCAYTMNTGLPP
eukprot:1211239-Pyramimonas_sp.AAC.1